MTIVHTDIPETITDREADRRAACYYAFSFGGTWIVQIFEGEEINPIAAWTSDGIYSGHMTHSAKDALQDFLHEYGLARRVNPTLRWIAACERKLDQLPLLWLRLMPILIGIGYLFSGIVQMGWLQRLLVSGEWWSAAPGWQREIAMFDFFVVLIAIFVFIYTDPYVDAGFLVVVGFLSLMLGTNHLFGIISEGSPGWHWILAIVNYSVAACCITIAVITLRRIYEFFRS